MDKYSPSKALMDWDEIRKKLEEQKQQTLKNWDAIQDLEAKIEQMIRDYQLHRSSGISQHQPAVES